MKWLNGDYAQTRASKIKHLPSLCEAFFFAKQWQFAIIQKWD